MELYFFWFTYLVARLSKEFIGFKENGQHEVSVKLN